MARECLTRKYIECDHLAVTAFIIKRLTKGEYLR